MKIRRGRQILVGLIVSLITAFIGLSVTSSVNAATIQELRQKREQLSREAERNKQQAEEKRKQAEKFTQQIKQLDQSITATQGKIDGTKSEIADAVATEDVLKSKIAQEQKDLEAAQDKQRVALGEFYMAPNYGLPLLAVSNQTITEESDKQAYLTAVEDTIEHTIQEIADLKTQLQTQKKEQEDREADLRNLQRKLEAYSQGLESQKDKKNGLLSDAQAAAVDFQKKFEEAKTQNAQIEAQINALAKASAKGGAIKSKDQGTSAVGFIWPLDYDYTTTEFGPTDSSYPFYPAISFHAGLDIVNKACGTPIYAAADGVANLRSYGNQAYGNAVIIGHNARFSTLYGHLQSYAVSDGEDVKQGDVIGFEGTTGWSSGCHVHFEVWDNGDRRNPRLYLP